MSDADESAGRPDFVEPAGPAWDDDVLSPPDSRAESAVDVPAADMPATDVPATVPASVGQGTVPEPPPAFAPAVRPERMAVGLACMFAGVLAGMAAFWFVGQPLFRTLVFGAMTWGMVSLYRLGAGVCRRGSTVIAGTLAVATVLFWLAAGLSDWWQFSSGLPWDDRWTMALQSAFSPGALIERVGVLLVMAALSLGSWFVLVRGVLRPEAGR